MLARLMREGVDVGGAGLVVGTSAGGLAAAMLRCGLDAAQMEELAATGCLDVGALHVSLPNPVTGREPSGDGSRHPATLAGLLEARRIPHLTAALAGILPPAGFCLAELARSVDLLHQAYAGRSWPELATWVPATDLASGQRVVFGVHGEPEATIGAAVAATCAVPGLLSPVRVGGRFYVDGGVVSFTNVDLAVTARPRRILVLNPLSTLPILGDSGTRAGVGRLLKIVLDRGLARSVAQARAQGISVQLVTPTPLEAQALGRRLMDFDRGPAILDAVTARPQGVLTW
jgi:NTE family protein